MEARHEAQMAALRATHSPTPGGQSVSFIRNKGFNKPYQGAVRWSAFFCFKRLAGSSG
jgi:hypothetical protein